MTQRPFTVRPISAAMALSLVVAGCGGGGESSPVEPVSTPASPSSIATGAAAPVVSLEVSTVPEVDILQPAAINTATAACSPAVKPGPAPATPVAWGGFDHPFSASSPWNSQPVTPVLSAISIPTSVYYPSVTSGTYSSGAFKALASDGPVTITGVTSSGIHDSDAEINLPSLTIPHWPANVVPATGSDGHAEIVDTVTGIVHSFWQLKKVGSAWQAAQYGWSPLAGRGMGDPAHYYQGSRSAGVSTVGGLMRIAEVADSDKMYRHALAMSLTYNALSANPTYQYPATSSDTNAATTNSGPIPMGSLMMLPANFDAQSLATPELRKVAETLKTYGAYVVDRNYGTPFFIYVENGANFQLHKNGWNAATGADLDRMRKALHPLQSAAGWLDGNGQPYVPPTAMNLLSMRGNWNRTKGTVSGVFDTWRQALVFPPTTTPIEQVNGGGRGYSGTFWANPVVGAAYRLTASTTGNARFRMTITDKTKNVVVYDSGDMSNAQVSNFSWPAANFLVSTYAKSGVGGVESVVRAELLAVPAPSSCP